MAAAAIACYLPALRTTLLARHEPGTKERLEQLVRAAHAGASITMTPLSESVRATLVTAWTGVALAAGLASIALVLAVIGIFGVFSSTVCRRWIALRAE